MPIDAEGLLEELGIKLGRSTEDEVFGLCPGHDDHRPTTWSLNRHTGAHFCFACGFGGTVDDLVWKLFRGNAFERIDLLKQYDADDIDLLPDSYYDRRRHEEPRFLADDFFDGLTDPPARVRDRRQLSLKACRHYGVLWDDRRSLWVTPIRLIGGKAIGWQEKNARYFRTLPEGVPKRTTLFGIDVFPPGQAAVLVESPLDVVRLYTAGFEGGVSSFGVVVDDEQMRLLLSVTDEVVLALDNDDEGRAETVRLITGKRPYGRFRKTTAWARKMKLYVYNYGRSKAKDPGEQTDDEIEYGIEKALHSTEVA